MATFFAGFAAASPALFRFLLLASDIVNWPVDNRAGLAVVAGKLARDEPKNFWFCPASQQQKAVQPPIIRGR